ncbi:MAG TPA: radical SAM protein [Candidatus Omnitrophota bacterium]|nr:radical SAM protein [Candidatus Omnitrophota bacterium]
MDNVLPTLVRDGIALAHVKTRRFWNRAPETVMFPVVWITGRCNLRCAMCSQWRTLREHNELEMSTEQWKRFIDEVADMRVRVLTITGGEPLLRDDLAEIVAHAKGRGIPVHLCTNGTLIDNRRAGLLAASGLDSVSISIDSSDPRVHNAIRGADCHSRAVDAVRCLRAASPRIRIGINCVISSRNVSGIEFMVAFAEELGADQIKFDSIHTNLMHGKALREETGKYSFCESDMPRVRQEMERLRSAIAKSRLLSNSQYFLERIAAGPGANGRHLPCYAGYISCTVDAFGRVSCCDHMTGEKSLKNETFASIWRSPYFKSMRDDVKRCRECCWDSTHGELNIRCSARCIAAQWKQLFRELDFYCAKDRSGKT